MLKPDTGHPFLRPLWLRIALVAICVIWAAVEFYGGSRIWGVIALAFAGYAAYAYLFRYSPPDEGENTPVDKE